MLKTAFSSFFRQHPALPYGICFCIGIYTAAAPSWSLLPLLLLVPLLRPFHLLVAVLACFYGFLTLPYGTPPQDRLIQIQFTPQAITYQHSHFGKKLFVSGIGSASFFRLPVRFSITTQELSLLQHTCYIKGRFSPINTYWTFIPEGPIQKKPYTFSLAPLRFQTKTYIEKILDRIYKPSRVAHFLSALTLGTCHDALLRFSFGRVGLQHILAISGLHFGLLALCARRVLSVILQEKGIVISLLILCSCYFLFIGSSPSITRAYLGICLYLLGTLWQKQTNALNLLGAVLCIELLLYPEHVTQAGFQLSFLATFAILLGARSIETLLYPLLPYHAPTSLQTLPGIERLVAHLCRHLRQTGSVNIAVHLTLLPICLAMFGTFPCISLLYNFFLPQAIVLGMMLFFVSCMVGYIPGINSLCIQATESWMNRVLSIIIDSPHCLDYSLRIPPCFAPFLPTLSLVWVLFLFALAVVHYDTRKTSYLEDNSLGISTESKISLSS